MTGDRFQRPPSLRASLAAAALATLALSSAPAAADPPASRPPAPAPSSAPATPSKKAAQADRDAARALAEQAFEKLQAKRYSAAIDLFLRAEERFHAPTHLVYLAQAQRKSGLLLEAADTYRKILAETLPRDAPQPFRDAQDEAKRELAPLLKRIPRVRVEVTGADPSSAVVEVAGRVVLAGAATTMNPGTVLVSVTPPGGARLERTVVLTESETSPEVVVRFEVPTSIPLAIPLAALGLGAVAGGAAIGLGLHARSMRVSAVEACRELLTCPQAELDKADNAVTLRDTAIATGIAAGVFLAAGVTLVLVRPAPKSTVDPPEAEAPTIAVRAGPSFVSLVGSF